MIDPGPDSEAHVRAVAVAVSVEARRVQILVTHGHPDHAPAARPLASALNQAGVPAEIAGPAGLEGIDIPLVGGDRLPTDDGELVAVDTPGHARLHLAFHWPERRALFVGDLLLGKGDTVWVGEYAGSVADYLRALERVRALEPSVLYPAHGPPLEDPSEAIDRFVSHRRERIRQVQEALASDPTRSTEELLAIVYGRELAGQARRAALLSVEALRAHVEGVGSDA